MMNQRKTIEIKSANNGHRRRHKCDLPTGHLHGRSTVTISASVLSCKLKLRSVEEAINQSLSMRDQGIMSRLCHASYLLYSHHIRIARLTKKSQAARAVFQRVEDLLVPHKVLEFRFSLSERCRSQRKKRMDNEQVLA